MKHVKVEVSELPYCDYQCGFQAHYDGRTNQGPWANMCENHFREYGVGLGLGKGQELIKERIE